LAILTSIHEVFPPPSSTGQALEDDPISLKKLLKGDGVWMMHKDPGLDLQWSLKWYIIKLPPEKIEHLEKELREVGCTTQMDAK